jgi:ElaB/YqjD/DUF883 family membrane-anchored ribosome-binding protein
MSQTPNSSDLGVSTTDRLASMAHDTIDRVKPRANRAELEVRDAATKTTEGVKQLQEQAVEAAEEGLSKARSYMSSNPLTTAGIAFAVGAVLGALIRR